MDTLGLYVHGRGLTLLIHKMTHNNINKTLLNLNRRVLFVYLQIFQATRFLYCIYLAKNPEILKRQGMPCLFAI